MRKYAKLAVAGAGAALEAVNAALPVSSTAKPWVGFALAVVTAAGVWLVPNTPETPPAH